MSNIFEVLPHPLPFETLIERIKESVPAFETLSTRAKVTLSKLQGGDSISCSQALDSFDKVTRELTAVVGVVAHLESVCTSDDVRAANEKLQELNAEFSASLYSDPQLYQFFAGLVPSPADERTYKNLMFAFESSGAKLNAQARERFIAIEQSLSDVTTQYSQAVVDSTKAWSWYAANESELPGVLESDRESAKEAAKAAGKAGGFQFSLQAPSYRAIVSFHQDRSVRENFSRAFSRRASDAPHDNTERVALALKLRAEKTQLIGYKNFVDLMTADRMAKNSGNVRGFFDSLRDSVVSAAERDLATLTAFAHRNGHPAGIALEAWDVPFYMQRYEEQELGLDPQEIREYFPFETTLHAIFDLLETVFGVSFAAANLPVWWQGVQSFSARGFNRELGNLYTDYYARENKRAGAWMDMLAPGIINTQRGIGFMAGNFSKPTAERPALLTHDEITTLFHEAGHLLHGLVCETPRAMEGMLSVAWDFVEVPSQLLENWAWEPVVLKRITKHYKTGKPMPDQLIAKLVKSRSVMNGLFYARHLGNSALDLELHTNYSETRDGNPVSWARNFLKTFVPYTLDDSATVNSFTHLFSDPEGYAGGYYSYLWSEALEADIYTAFAGDNVLSRETGERFVREVLMLGDTKDAGDLFVSFMGRAPNPAALLKRVRGE